MSVHSLAPVWEKSEAAANDLLVLLTIADMANDGHGFAWAKVVTVAKKARLSRGACYERLYALIEMGELRMFKRGHKRSPAFVITIVDTPLSNDEIKQRLYELDPNTDWHEHHEIGDELFLAEGSSGITTNPENDTAVSIPADINAVDQGVYRADGREKRSSGPSDGIVRNQDEPSAGDPGIVRNQDKIVMPAGQDRPASATNHIEPFLNRIPNRARGVEISESDLRKLARDRAVAKGAHNVEALTAKILREDREDLIEDLREFHRSTIEAEARQHCDRCDDAGFYDSDDNTRSRCTHPQILEEAHS